MQLKLTTAVKADYQSVWKGFDKNLFLALAPPGAKVEVVRFDGCVKGDVVQLKLKMPLMPVQNWTSHIIENGFTTEEAWFIDQSQAHELPFFLKTWQHRHGIVRRADGGTDIVDDIQYTAPFGLMTVLMYPVLWLQFAWRKPIYKRFFGGGI